MSPVPPKKLVIKHQMSARGTVCAAHGVIVAAPIGPASQVTLTFYIDSSELAEEVFTLEPARASEGVEAFRIVAATAFRPKPVREDVARITIDMGVANSLVEVLKAKLDEVRRLTVQEPQRE